MATYCRNHAVALWPAGAGTQAQLDLALLITGAPPRFLLERRDSASQQRYYDAVARGWAVLANDLGPAAEDELTRTLRKFLAEGTWARDAAQAAAVIGLVDLLTRDGRRRR